MPSRSPVTTAPMAIDVFPDGNRFPDPARFASYAAAADQAYGQAAMDERVSPMSQAVFPKEEPSFEGTSDESAT